MTANVLNAVVALSTVRNNNLSDTNLTYNSRVNFKGGNFELYVKDILTGNFYYNDKEREAAYKKHFSYVGSQNKAVDAIAKFGDAFEILKVESGIGTRSAGKLALNNSPPKDVLHKYDPRLRRDVKEIDGGEWTEKDIFYVVGAISEHKIKRLYFVQGKCYAAKEEIYSKVFEDVKNRVEETVKNSGLEFQPTKELGRIYHIDPLEITDFRLRGMWEIRNPLDVFRQYTVNEEDFDFLCLAIMEEEKFLDLLSLRKAEAGDFLQDIGGNKLVTLDRIQIKDPNNPNNLKKAVLIKVSWE